ncbi:biotin-dependent carboxyltransferase family protein [Celeribacter indicus]|uniref:Allophanate hydrolase subunit 2 n=1 Tax=Celeribacter indicus TaxID=1208324 RepID=A0A0B5DWL8_9RHOB|nr:biotin-dependent carboxyltransferase family protein [Celeribacter indicus]AJE47813.1 allophanate hydrolase subunit 2 [Celeribacter indicus]SDW23738.1 biotin-dependent carboxylase uncharacterized domain-containing protein [Celeribacter indicus]
MTVLAVERAEGLLSVQDLGRPGHLAQGVARGGAMDRQALIEAAALLGAETALAAVELAGAGGRFRVEAPTRIALTGAPMQATLDGQPLEWNRTHLMAPGQTLRLARMEAGLYAYLTPAGGIATPPWLGSRAAHLAIGIGARLGAGDRLPCGDDPDPQAPARAIAVAPRFSGGTVRIMDGPQSGLFDAQTRARFLSTPFLRAPEGNRQGLRLEAPEPFRSDHAAGLASDVIGPGDIQMTGEGVPYVLMAECQTIGGYPRIGTVLPADLPVVAQARPGAPLSFRHVALAEADALWRDGAAALREAAGRCRPVIRDPATIKDLLSYQLIGGVTAGDDLDRET